jgi:hypothetical protein
MTAPLFGTVVGDLINFTVNSGVASNPNVAALRRRETEKAFGHFASTRTDQPCQGYDLPWPNVKRDTFVSAFSRQAVHPQRGLPSPFTGAR